MTITSNRMEATTSFLVEWVRAPLTTASAVPSSRTLARKMVAPIDPSRAPVIELGPGTGVFTRQLLARGILESELILFELNPNFARRLRQLHPKARVIQGGAEQLNTLDLGALVPPESPLPGAVVSGLPLLTLEDWQIDAILGGAFGQMRPDGIFMQFTYGPRCPVPGEILRRHGLKARRTGFVANNLPPASVYRISRI